MFLNAFKRITSAGVPSLQLVRRLDIITADGGGLYLNGSALAAAELGYIDGITAIGTAQASKAVVLDTAKGIVGLGVTSVGTSNTSGVVLTASVTNALQVVAEDGGVSIASGNPKAIKGRFFVKANPGDCTIDGVLGQVKINTSITCSADYTNGIRGYLELVGGNTVNTGGANANTGCGGHGVHGWITAADNLTIAASHYLCGVASRLSVTAAKTITATGKLVAYGVFADDNLGGATPTQAWGYGMYIPKGVVNCGIRIGDWKASQASGNAIVFGTGMNYDADGQLDIVGVFGESTGDLTSAYSAKAGRYRYLVSCSADTVINQETYGLVGQLVVKNGSLNHYHAGIMGTFETNTDCDIQTSYCSAGVSSRLGGAGTTVESGGLLAGFAAIQHMSAFTATGTLAAFATHKTSTGIAWPIGLYLASAASDIGISIGACTTTGIDFGLTVGTTSGDGSASLIRAGYAASGGHTTPNAPIVFATANQHAIQAYLHSSLGKFTGMEINAYTSDIATNTDSPCAAIEAVGRSLATATGTNSIYGIRAEAQVLASKAGPRTNYELIAGFFKTGVSATAATYAGKTICAKLDLGVSINATQGDFGLYIRNNSESLIGAGPTRCSSACQAIHFDGGYANVFSFGEVQNVNYGDAWSLTGSGGAGHIRVRMWNGAAYATKYIRLFD